MGQNILQRFVKMYIAHCKLAHTCNSSVKYTHTLYSGPYNVQAIETIASLFSSFHVTQNVWNCWAIGKRHADRQFYSGVRKEALRKAPKKATESRQT